MRLGRALLILVVALGHGAVIVPTASADDASLRAAGKSRDGQFSDLSKRTTAAFRGWSRSGFSVRGQRRIVRLHRQTRREIDLVSANVRSEQPSSGGGADYKRLLLRSLRYFDGALRSEVTGVRARTADRVRAAKRAFRRAGGQFRRSVRLERAAIRAIRHANARSGA